MSLSLAALAAAVLGSTPAGRPCEALAGLAVENGSVTAATAMAAGDWQDPGGEVHPALPSFCRVELQLSGGRGSAIRAEVWLPDQGWNGRLLGTGSGAYGGTVRHDWLEVGLVRGYATVNDDMGAAPARSVNGAPLMGQPVKWLDFGWRSIHIAAIAARQVVTARYGRAPHHAYFAGCSQGGRQALMGAQRHPEDYDGIVAGCSAGSMTAMIAQVAWQHRALRASPGSRLGPEKVAALKKGVLDACPPTDAGPDGERWLAEPARCEFDPTAVRCHEGDAPGCLSADQVAAARAIYQGPRNPRTGAPIWPGLPPGAEAPLYLDFVANKPQPPWDGAYRWVLGADLDAATLDLDRDVAAVQAVVGPILDVTSADYSSFAGRGGKIILWHGWSDPIVPATASVGFYERVVAAGRGAKGRSDLDVARLYLVPGVGHCAGGPGPDAFGGYRPPPVSDPDHDVLEALARWVEKGVAPGRIVATKFVEDDPAKGVAFQRPICPYPQVARHRGSGDRTKAESFECAMPARTTSTRAP